MKVLLIGPYAPDSQYSITAFTGALRRGLKYDDMAIEEIAPASTIYSKLLAPLLGRRAAFIDKFLVFPYRLRKIAMNYDLVHIAEHGYALYTRHLRSKTHLVTCHDLIVAKAALGEIPDWPLSEFAIKYQMSIIKSLGLSSHVSAVSEATRLDVVKYTALPEQRTSLVYNGFYRQVLKIEDRKAMKTCERLRIAAGQAYLLHVGGNQPNKNRQGVVRIFESILDFDPSLDLKLVMAGPSPDRGLRTIINQSRYSEKIIPVEHPKDEEIAALYKRAKALLFPSLYEGFGLPIIEAQANGCPVITTSRVPMTEIGGAAALYIEPSDPDEAAANILSKYSELSDMIEPGFENIKRFSTESMCSNYKNLYTRLVEQNGTL